MSKSVSKPPPTPLEELLAICVNATDGKTWGVGQGVNNRKRPVWYVYCSSKKALRQIPDTYRARKVVGFFCPRPRIVN